jgi:hypothetical protein
MATRKTKIIKDNKRRGEWAESVFMARVAEYGLPVSKPVGDSNTFDCVVGRPGKFVAVQVKCTLSELPGGKGYGCAIKTNNKAYRPGAFDFVAAYVIPEDVWYIIPEKLIRGRQLMSLSSPAGKFEQYREAWHLLREATACEAVAGELSHEEVEDEPESQPGQESPLMGRVGASFGFMRRRLVGGEE